MAPRYSLLDETGDPAVYAPVRQTVLEQQIRAGLRRAANPARGVKPQVGGAFGGPNRAAAGVQDLAMGLLQAGSAPITSLMSMAAPAAPYVQQAADAVGKLPFPMPDAIRTGKAPTVKEAVRAPFNVARGAAEATGYPKQYADELADNAVMAGAGLMGKAAGPIAKTADAAFGPMAADGTVVGANGANILSVRSARNQGITPTTKNTQRIAFPGIYKHPNELTDDAASLVAPESPALKGLFGVTRDDLYQMNKGRKGNVDATQIFPAKARGSEAAGNVITDKNAQRLVDAMSVAEQRAPQLTNPMDAWYVMDPAFQRMVQLVGKDEAIKRFHDFNAFTSMASPASDVITEMNRGTTANYLNRQGRFGDFEKHSVTPVAKRGSDFPADISGLKPHPYGGTAHSQPMRKYVDGGLLDNGFLNVDTSKVPTYHMASGVPETGFQTNVPVGDAHFARAIGLPDVRNMLTLKGKPVIPAANATMPEVSTLTPWWQQKVVGPLGIESVPGQARAWGLFSPQSGVDTPIGAPKLELLAAEIDKLAKQAGVDPAMLRDQVLLGNAGLGNNPAMLRGLLSGK